MVVFKMNLKSWKRCLHALQSIKLVRGVLKMFHKQQYTFVLDQTFKVTCSYERLRLGGNLKLSGFDPKEIFFALLPSVLIECKIQWCLADL